MEARIEPGTLIYTGFGMKLEGGTGWKFRGQQLAVVVRETPVGYMVRKWLDGSRRWTGNVRVLRGEIIGPMPDGDTRKAKVSRAMHALDPHRTGAWLADAQAAAR